MNAKRKSSAALSVFLVLTLVVFSSPVSATDLPPVGKVLGTISVVGNVQVRGISLPREGTLFSGDSIRTDEKAYAKVTLRDGNRVEASGASDFVVKQDGSGVHVGLTSGHLGFLSPGNLLAFVLGRYEVVPKAGSTGSVGLLGPETAAINVLHGSVTLREPATKQSMEISSGGQYVLRLKANGPIAQVVSLIPPSVPTAGLDPEPSPGQTTGTIAGISKKKALLLLAAAGAATAIIVPLATQGDENNTNACAAPLAKAKQIGSLTLTAAQQTQTAIAPVLSTNAVASAQNAVITTIITGVNKDLQTLQSSNLSCATVGTTLGDIENLANQLNASLTALANGNLPPGINLPGKVPASISRPD
jgi:hypothetical protein